MLMWFCGLGIGHKNTWQATHTFQKDICAAFKLPDLYKPDDDGDDDVEMSDVDSSSWPPSRVSGSQSSKSLVDDADVEEWENISSNSDPKDVDEDGSNKEGWCDEDDNPVKAKGDADDVEALGFSQL
ncbi:hypothetical protein F5146DRAFT_1002860 [Armillaria mellea]|nr:hypothetical protein F5146DRAFT_1002860 [Armillaria mellea]